MNNKQNQQHDNAHDAGSPERQPYEAPAIIYEGTVTTRAGSGIPKPKDTDVLPERLFGGGD